MLTKTWLQYVHHIANASKRLREREGRMERERRRKRKREQMESKSKHLKGNNINV